MIIKERTIPQELVLLKSTLARTNVPEKTENQIISLEKGYIGEKLFDQKLERLSLDCLIINDLLLETANTHYQIDSLLIIQRKIHIFEVKNFTGDYLIDGDRMRLLSGKEIKNPLIQLSRSESLLRQLLQQYGSSLKVEAHLVFINPEFHLYGASPDLPIIFPSQLGRFLNQLNSQPSKLTGQHNTLAKKLIDLHVKDSPFSLLPAYSFDEMKKGILCVRCYSGFMRNGDHHSLICEKCKFVEDMESAILRSVEEFTLLFPDRKMTTNDIYEWCKVVKSKATIRKLLQSKYKHVRFGISSYFE